MHNLLKQTRRRVVAMAFVGLAVVLLFTAYFSLFVWRDNSRKYPPAQAWENTLRFAIILGVAIAVYTGIVIVVFAIRNDTKRILGRYPPEKLALLEEQTGGINFFTRRITVTSLFLIMNNNGMTLKLVPLEDILSVEAIVTEMGMRRRRKTILVMYVYTHDGTKIKSSAMEYRWQYIALCKDVKHELQALRPDIWFTGEMQNIEHAG